MLVDDYLERYVDPSFKPCVVICTRCESVERAFDDLELPTTIRDVRLYASPSNDHAERR